ncbi:MAG TPA: KH domain-containing protein [Spirochaetota bacterium]|nr:KH domain-containing protein [Spirochaetota bacterium]
MAKEKELVEYLVKTLVDKPDDVQVNLVEGENTNIIEIKADNDDYGKIIGRKGRIVNSIRTLLAVCARDSGKRWLLDVPDKENRDS